MILGKRYDDVMEHIEVTPEMYQRILTHIKQMDLTKDTPHKTIRFPSIKQLAALAACLAVVLVGALTLPDLFQPSNDPDHSGVLATGNGIIQVDSVEELTENVGFEIAELNGLSFQVQKITYTAYWQKLAEIVYSGEGQTVVYRKGIGSEDVSGDYNVYEAETEILVGDTAVTLKGNNKTYTLAIWIDDEFTYSISLSEGMTENEWERLLA